MRNLKNFDVDTEVIFQMLRTGKVTVVSLLSLETGPVLCVLPFL